MSDRPVLIDTSIWIEVFREASTPLKSHVEGLLVDDRGRLCGAVAAELLQGAMAAREIDAIESLVRSIPLLEENDQTWLEAGRLGKRLREKGCTVGLLDCYIAVLAGSHGCALLSLDKHFALIAKHSSLHLDLPPAL